MEAIRSSEVTTTQQPKKTNKALKHALNAGMTVAGLAGVKGAFDLSNDLWMYAQMDDLVGKGLNPHVFKPSCKTPPKILLAKKIKNFFENLGEKLFKNPKIHQMFEKYERRLGTSGDDLARAVKFNKGCAAKVLTLATVALSILAAGIYKAGKINGEG